MMDLTADIALQIEPVNKTIQFSISNLAIVGFNVTIDNCGVKSDESGIKGRLNTVILAIEASVNSLFRALAPRLPEFNSFSYDIAFDYQNGAFGTGINVLAK